MTAATGSKRAVRQYFDGDAESYAKAYDGSLDDTRTCTFVERRTRSLGLLREPLGRVLDIGAGPGVFTDAILARGGVCTVVDLSFDMIARARGRMSPPAAGRAFFAVADIDHLPFKDGAFDTVLCIGVLQYVDDGARAVEELARVVAPRGQIVVSFPNRTSPLNRLHAAAVGGARMAMRVLSRIAAAKPSSSRLTFRADVTNRAFTQRELERWASAAGLDQQTITYHLLLFPFAIPGLGPVLRAWNRFVRDKTPRGPFLRWGREGIARYVRP